MNTLLREFPTKEQADSKRASVIRLGWHPSHVFRTDRHTWGFFV